MADIHGNRQAFEACLRDSERRGADGWAFLGDYVGYGGDPVWVIETLMARVRQGSVAVLGNHDLAISEPSETHSPEADLSLAWTRHQLGPAARAFLAGLPRRVEVEGCLLVHATPAPGPRWPYLDTPEAAGRALQASGATLAFGGHVHAPTLYGLDPGGKCLAFRPVPGVPIPLPPRHRWLAIVGSVGQPRDGNRAAAYALLDTPRRELTFHRVPYDLDGAIHAIRRAGLPESLALRLEEGR